ncbi:MAG: hypothetical protein IPL78_25975 [Chloroflexi bacterium]|nr:hypothetical protein [Chloroflexota bacterium]
MLHLCRYIHANPIVHGLIQTIDDWPYSNYPEWVETRSGSLVDRAFVQAHFSTPTQYREFVLDYLISRRHPDGLNYFERLGQFVPARNHQASTILVPGYGAQGVGIELFLAPAPGI